MGLTWMLLAASAGVAAAQAAPLFQNGETAWRICLPERAGAVEHYAAEELRTVLKKISGADFLVVSNGVPKEGRAIVLGSPQSSDAVRTNAARLKLDLESPSEHLVVRTLDGNLYLAGNMPRAGLFAVYRFLQRELGVRWLWPGDDGEFIPKRQSWDVPELDISEKAGIRIRELTPCWYHTHPPTEIWFARNLLNAGSLTPEIREKLGFLRMGGGHGVSTHGIRFEDKPEWFSMIGGKRAPEGVAGCWSNPDFTKHIVGNMVAGAKRGNLELINYFPEDVTQRCECPDCTRNPDVSARWWNYYAKLIDEVRKELPELKFAGLAYQEYRNVPGVPVRGVEFVEYGQYNRCYVHKLDDPGCGVNRASMAELKRWMEKAPMGVYGYHFDIFEPWMYVPFWNMLADEMRTYRSLNLVRVKSEMWLNPSSDVAREDLRTMRLRLPYYLYARLAWNPDEKTEDLLADWCEVVYGPAAAEMRAYHTAMAESWDGMPAHLTYYFNKPVGVAKHFLNPMLIASAEKRFQAAEAKIGALADSPEKERLYREVKLESACLRQWIEPYWISMANHRVVSLPKTDSFDRALPLRMTSNGGTHLPTEAVLYWDAEALHLRLVCNEPEMAKLRKGAVGRDLALWQEDHVELFIEMDDGSGYRHLAFNPAGGTYDARAKDESWNPAWQLKIDLGGNAWTAELRLPFSELGVQPAPGSQWRLVLNRNSRPEACGFPVPAYHDLSSGAVVYFSEVSRPERTLTWIDSENRGLDGAARSLLKQGWNFRYFDAKNALKADLAESRLIVISTAWLYRTNFPAAFWGERLLPAVKSGAVVLFDAYGEPDLDKYFQIPDFYLGFNDWDLHPLRQTTFIATNSFANTPDDLSKVLGHTPPGVFMPREPKKWEVLARQKMKDNREEPYLLARPYGKGMVVVSGLIGYAKGPDQAVSLLNNLLEYNQAIKRE
jgi:hypothetical protein